MESLKNYFGHKSNNADEIDAPECGDNYFINNDLIDIQQYYEENDVYFTNNAAFDAFKKKDINKLQFLVTTGLAMSNMFIDVSLDEGDMELFKFFLNECKLKPSLYAKQMASINGHHSLITYLEAMRTPLRNDVSINQVHYNFKTKEWSDCIPEEYRF